MYLWPTNPFGLNHVKFCASETQLLDGCVVVFRGFLDKSHEEEGNIELSDSLRYCVYAGSWGEWGLQMLSPGRTVTFIPIYWSIADGNHGFIAGSFFSSVISSEANIESSGYSKSPLMITTRKGNGKMNERMIDLDTLRILFQKLPRFPLTMESEICCSWLKQINSSLSQVWARIP